MPNDIIIPQVELTPDESIWWDNQRALMHISVPHYGVIFYEMLSHGDKRAVFTDIIPVAATDGACLMINPKTYFYNYDPGEQLFINGHEIKHCVFGHPELFMRLGRMGKVPISNGKTLPWVNRIGQMAGDYVINAIQVAEKIGKMPKDALYDLNIATPFSSFFDAYENLWERLPAPIIEHWGVPSPQPGAGTPTEGPPDPQGGSQDASEPSPGTQGQPDTQGPPQPSLSPADQYTVQRMERGTFDVCLKPGSAQGKDPVQAEKERNESKWRRVIDHAMDVARQQGRLPDTLERLFTKVIEPQVDWTEKLHATVNRTIGRDAWSYDNPDQEWASRDIFVPGRSGYGAADVIVGGDVSGSVSDEEIDIVKAEIGGILEQIKPRRLFVLWCDTRITRVDELHDAADLASLPAPTGGGGTSFVPPFEWVETNRIPLGLEVDGFIYITDLAGDFPKSKPDFPTIWASVAGRTHVPFGEIVEVPRKGRPRRSY